jgi:hypothetical protein
MEIQGILTHEQKISCIPCKGGSSDLANLKKSTQVRNDSVG